MGLSSFLDFFDFISNSVLMPIVHLTCIFVGHVIKPQAVIEEVGLNGPFSEKNFRDIHQIYRADFYHFDSAVFHCKHTGLDEDLILILSAQGR